MEARPVQIVRRRYNDWVANDSIEDYALRYAPSSFRKFSATTVGHSLIGTNSALSYEAIGALLLLEYGFTNAIWAMVFAAIVIFLVGLPICNYSARHNIDMDLLTRAAGFGYVGSTFTSLIYASFTFIFLALETAIMAQAVKLCFGIPLWLGYILCTVVVIPIVFYGVTAINRFHQWSQPVWLLLLILPFYFVMTREPGALDSLTNFVGQASGSNGFDLFHFGIAAGISFALIAQIGEQVDYLRFMPERTRANRWSWWFNMLLGGPGWIAIAFVKQVGGALLAAVAVLAGIAIVDAKEPVQLFNHALGYALDNPETTLVISALFVILSELKVNVTNAYAGSLAWSNFFSRVTYSHPGRVVWLLFNCAIALLLMELDLFEAMNSVLGLYSNIAVAWIFALVADLAINKPLGLSPPLVEFKRAHLYNVNPVGVVSMVLASVGSIIAFSGALGAYAQAYSWLIAAVISLVASPILAVLTKGKYYIARRSPFAPGSNAMVSCVVCGNDYVEEDSAHCPYHGGTICSLCCTLDSTCKDSCKPELSTPLDHYRDGVAFILDKLLRRRISRKVSLRTANFLLIWTVMLGVIAAVLWLTLPTLKNAVPEIGVEFNQFAVRVFFGLAIFSSVATWWIVLVGESRDLAERDYLAAKERAEQHALDLKLEQAKTRELLHNVLPKEIAEELTQNGVARPARHDAVTILFTDFAGFTQTASTMPADRVVAELNEIFAGFDQITDECGVEKIKTVGDAYMAAAGLPKPHEDHALRCVRAGLKMVEFIEQRNRSAGVKWSLRVGVHSGTVVAGVVGTKKFAFDIWGDTVNVASRMESASEVGQVNVSASTYDLVSQEFDCEYRGKIDAKGKGEMDMYFVVGKKIS